MPYRLNIKALYKAAALLGDTSDTAIRERTGIALGTFSRMRNGLVEPSIRQLHTLSKTYNVPVDELYKDEAEPPSASAVA